MKQAQSGWRAKGPWTVYHSRTGNYRCLSKRECWRFWSRQPWKNFKIVEKGGLTIERLLMNPNPTESNVCGRPKCIPCKKNPDQKKRICSKSNILYNYECDEKDSCPDSTYDGQSSKNLYTRSLTHDYKNDKKHKDSFMHLHQEKSHNNANENFKLSVRGILN